MRRVRRQPIQEERVASLIRFTSLARSRSFVPLGLSLAFLQISFLPLPRPSLSLSLSLTPPVGRSLFLDLSLSLSFSLCPGLGLAAGNDTPENLQRGESGQITEIKLELTGHGIEILSSFREIWEDSDIFLFFFFFFLSFKILCQLLRRILN